MRVVISIAVVAVALVLTTAAGAAEPIHVKIDETFTDNVCGLDVSGHIVGVDNFWPVFDSAGNLISFKDTSSVKLTWTRNGRSLVVASAGHNTGVATGDFGGLVTFTTTVRGIPERILTPGDGGVITRDAGNIVIQDVVDFSTNPEGDPISSTILVNNGPHPEADSGFELFCQVFTQALG